MIRSPTKARSKRPIADVFTSDGAIFSYFGIACLTAILWATHYRISETEKKRAACEQTGGVFVEGENRSLCLDKRSIK